MLSLWGSASARALRALQSFAAEEPVHPDIKAGNILNRPSTLASLMNEKHQLLRLYRDLRKTEGALSSTDFDNLAKRFESVYGRRYAPPGFFITQRELQTLDSFVEGWSKGFFGRAVLSAAVVAKRAEARLHFKLLATRIVRKRLRSVNQRITVIFRCMRSPKFFQTYAVIQDRFFELHGAHPPHSGPPALSFI